MCGLRHPLEVHFNYDSIYVYLFRKARIGLCHRWIDSFLEWNALAYLAPYRTTTSESKSRCEQVCRDLHYLKGWVALCNGFVKKG